VNLPKRSSSLTDSNSNSSRNSGSGSGSGGSLTTAARLMREIPFRIQYIMAAVDVSTEDFQVAEPRFYEVFDGI